MMPRRRKANRRLELQGSVWISVGDQNLGGSERFGLLRAVASEGSITQAAKAYGISYKAAWDALEAMNTLVGAGLGPAYRWRPRRWIDALDAARTAVGRSLRADRRSSPALPETSR